MKIMNKIKTTKKIGDLVTHITGGPAFVIVFIEQPSFWGYRKGMVQLEKCTKKGCLLSLFVNLEKLKKLWKNN